MTTFFSEREASSKLPEDGGDHHHAGHLGHRARLLDGARLLASQGLVVFPVRPDKTPFGPWRHLDATNLRGLDGCIRAFEGCALAVRTGAVVDVLDVESVGLDHFPLASLPLTPTARTQRGGLHFYFQSGRLRQTSIEVDGVHVGDVRAQGGYVLAPPSRGVHGEYSWLPGRAMGEVPLAVVPDELVERLDALRGGVPRRGHSGPASARPPVTPLSRKYPSRSEEDAAVARRLWIDGYERDDIVEVLRAGAAGHDRGTQCDRYAERTVDRVIEWTGAELAEAAEHAVDAEIYAVRTDATRADVTFRVPSLEPERQLLKYPLDWPVTDRSRARVRHLWHAADLAESDEPSELLGRRVRLELVRVGRSVRIARVFPPRRHHG